MFRCLCCQQPVTAPRERPVTEREAFRALGCLTALGYTVESLRTTHRANLDYTWPGFSAWLDRHAAARLAIEQVL